MALGPAGDNSPLPHKMGACPVAGHKILDNTLSCQCRYCRAGRCARFSLQAQVCKYFFIDWFYEH